MSVTRRVGECSSLRLEADAVELVGLAFESRHIGWLRLACVQAKLRCPLSFVVLLVEPRLVT